MSKTLYPRSGSNAAPMQNYSDDPFVSVDRSISQNPSTAMSEFQTQASDQKNSGSSSPKSIISITVIGGDRDLGIDSGPKNEECLTPATLGHPHRFIHGGGTHGDYGSIPHETVFLDGTAPSEDEPYPEYYKIVVKCTPASIADSLTLSYIGEQACINAVKGTADLKSGTCPYAIYTQRATAYTEGGPGNRGEGSTVVFTYVDPEGNLHSGSTKFFVLIPMYVDSDPSIQFSGKVDSTAPLTCYPQFEGQPVLTGTADGCVTVLTGVFAGSARMNLRDQYKQPLSGLFDKTAVYETHQDGYGTATSWIAWVTNGNYTDTCYLALGNAPVINDGSSTQTITIRTINVDPSPANPATWSRDVPCTINVAGFAIKRLDGGPLSRRFSVVYEEGDPQPVKGDATPNKAHFSVSWLP